MQTRAVERRRRRAVFAAGLAACSVAPPDTGVDGGVATGGAPAACAAAEAAAFSWSVEPVPEDISLDVACVLGEPARDGDARVVPLACDEPDGPRARTLVVAAAPAAPDAALRAGTAARLTVVQTDGGAWLRLAAGERLLVAAASGEALAPPDGAAPWAPFVAAPAATSCAPEECERRVGVDWRRSGGAPTVVLDGGTAALGDRGEVQAWVATARVDEPGCAGGTWFVAGLVATR